MASQTYQLVMHKGPNPGKIYELVQEELTIGRDITNRIVINDPEVSRKHCRLSLQSGAYVIEDLGSTNGTFVDGQRLIGPHMLRPGETIMLGEKINMVYETLGFDPNATVATVQRQPAPPTAPRETYKVDADVYDIQTPVQPAQPPAYYQPPPSPPVYSGNVPPGPADPYLDEPYELPPEAQAPRRSKTWLFIGCGALLLILCCLVVGAIAFDTMDLYCTSPFDAFFSCP